MLSQPSSSRRGGCHHRTDVAATARPNARPDCGCTHSEQPRRAISRSAARSAQTGSLPEMLRFIRQNGDQFGDQFYMALFRKYPQMAMRFPSIDRATRQTALWGALDAITSPPKTLSDVDEQLGTRHAASGVQAEEYGNFISVLIDTMADFLGANFTPEAGTTCAELLRQLSEQMARVDARN